MRRYEGEPLPAGSKIAVVANDALGNYVVSTPLLQSLRTAHPGAIIHYFSGTRTEELWAVDPKIDWGYPLYGSNPHHSILHTFVENKSNPYDLVINLENNQWAKCFAAAISGLSTFLCGPALGADGRSDLPFEENPRGKLWQDDNWIATDILERYAFLESPFIGEIFCRQAYLSDPVPAYDVPSAPVEREIPDVLIATAASLPEKLWPVEHWIDILTRFQKAGISAGLLGARPTAQSAFWKGSSEEERLVEKRLVTDLRGKFTLPEVVGALSKTKRVLTLDNGILHLAVAAKAPTVGLYRNGIHRLWAPPSEHLTVLKPQESMPVSEIGPDEVWEALRLG